MIYQKLLLGAVLLFGVRPSFALEDNYPLAVDSTLSGDTAIAAPASGMVSRSKNQNLTIKLNMSCFGTNLRGVGNPISPNALVTGNLTLNIAGTDYSFFVKFPGQLVSETGIKSAKVQPMNPSYYGGPGNPIKSAGVFGNTILLNTTLGGVITVDGQGQIHEPPLAQKGVNLKSYQFSQEATCVGPAVFGSMGHSTLTPAYPCGEFMGKTGVISTVFRSLSVSADQSMVDIDFAFPGQTGFCGGYWSPLMIFLDEDRPKFDNLSSFPLNKIGKTYWPEAKSKGYFLALDQNGNQLIDQKEELFGQNEGAENGFEALRKLDTNKDGVIDSKDADFKKLLLWNDANGDGSSDAQELTRASKMIKSISLKYVKGHVQPIGRHAEAREFSEVVLQQPGSAKKAKIIDMWFAPETK